MEKDKIDVVIVQCPVWCPSFPSIGISYISSYLRKKNYKIKVLDLNIDFYHELDKQTRELFYHTGNFPDQEFKKKIDKIIKEKLDFWVKQILNVKAKIITFSVQYTSIDLSIAITKEIKKRKKDAIILFGGSSCSNVGLREKEKLDIEIKNNNIDGIIVGEGELIIEKVLKDIFVFKKIKERSGLILKSQKNKTNEKRETIVNLDTIPFPDFSDFDMSKYLSNHTCLMLLSRGCPNNCTFCFEKKMWDYYRFRSAKNIIDELKLRIKQGYSSFFFIDELLNGNLTEFSKLCDLIIKNKMNITWGVM